MQNTYFIYSNDNQEIIIERFHICTWEFYNNTSFVEFGCELKGDTFDNKQKLELNLFIPWLSPRCSCEDFYNKLKGPENSRFIFNDSIQGTESLDGGQNLKGVIHKFSDRNQLCILPINLHIIPEKQTVRINVNLDFYNQIQNTPKPNVYFRFSVTPDNKLIATRKDGITKSTVIYDIRINQRRNLPIPLLEEIVNRKFCIIKRCFCFNIIPNSYDLVFFDSTILQNVRTLEFESFNRYLPDKRIRKDELLVVYNRKDDSDAFGFFTIFAKEHIGMDQLAIAVFISLASGILLFIPSYKISFNKDMPYSELWLHMPFLFWFVLILVASSLAYFIYRKFYK